MNRTHPPSTRRKAIHGGSTPASMRVMVVDKHIRFISQNSAALIQSCYTSCLVMVITYQHKDHTPLAHVAFILASSPAKILVNDDDACDLPESYPERLKPYVLSLFNYNNQVASILNIARLSTGEL